MSDREPIDVLIADDHPIYRRGLADLVGADPKLRVVAEAGTGREAVDLFLRHRPAVVLMDQRMPDMGGVAATNAILVQVPDARIVVVSSSDGDVDIQRAVDAGARGYVLKDAPGQEILDAIHAVHAGRRYLPPVVADRLAAARAADPLTARELDVLRLLARGFSNRQISHELAIEETTVKLHMHNVLEKLDAEHRTEALALALQRGIIHLGD